MSERQIRSFVRRVLESAVIDEDDEQEGEGKDEVSAGGVAGVTTPLGTGPRYPNREKSRRVPAYVAAGKAFGNAKLKKKKRK